MKKALILMPLLGSLLLTSCGYSEKTKTEFLEQIRTNAARHDQPSYTIVIQKMLVKTVDITTTDKATRAGLIVNLASMGVYEGSTNSEMAPASSGKINATAVDYLGRSTSNIKYYVHLDGSLKISFDSRAVLTIPGSSQTNYIETDEYNYMKYEYSEMKVDGPVEVSAGVTTNLKMKLVIEVTYTYS